MQDLILRAGPALIARRWETDEGADVARLIEVDFTDRVHEMLFELVTLDAAFTLGDIFRLMERSPLLQQVFFREFAEELCAEARKGPIVGVAARASLEHIEYLELYQQWGLDTSTQVYSSTQRLHLHGVGPELTEDAPDHSRQRGQRVQWSLSLTPLRGLLPFPLRVNAEVQVVEDDVHAKAHHREIARARHPDVTLGQVIHGVLWELSFHGGPQEQAQVADELHQQVAAIDAGTAELVSGDDFFDDLDRPGCEALFEDLGGQSVRDISHALRDIEDDENAAAWIEKAFDGLVRVKPQFRDRTGREFRKAFRAAAR